MKWSLTSVLIKTYKDMERIAKRKSWRTLVLALGVVLLVGGGIFIACQKEANVEVLDSQQDHGVEYPIPEGAVFSIDNIHLIKEGSNIPWEPWFDTKGQGDPVSFGGTNRYYLPYNIKNYVQYRKLLEGDGKSKYNILRYVIGTYNPEVGAYPIIRVELPKPADREWFERSYEPIQTSAARTRSAVTMTLARARQFFAQFKNLSCAVNLQCPCIPFQYAADGCYARAHYMRKLMADAGYDSQKIFVYATLGALQAETKAGCCQAWMWHVAPLVGVEKGNSTELMVIDPSLFDAPVGINTWISKMKSSCAGYPRPSVVYSIKPAYVYRPSGERDDDYSKTLTKMDEYSSLSGCNW